MRIHTLPRFFIEKWQRKELKNVVTDAYNNVTFYGSLCKARSLHPNDIKTLSDIQKFPLTSRELFRTHQIKDVMDQRFLAAPVTWHQTSGSTGEPFRFPLNIQFYFRNKFGIRFLHVYLDRYLYWKGYTQKHIAEHFRFCEIRLSPTARGKNYLHIPTPDLQKDPEGVFRRLSGFKPDTVESRPTLLVELARLAEKISPARRPHFRFAYANGEVLTPSQREYIQTILGAEVYSRYGLEECWGVAIECAFHNGLHISEESFLVEILDGNNKPVAADTYGRVIITNFHNRTLPFIRYETGDQGKILPNKCPCGLWAKRIIVRGRSGGFFSLGARRFNYAEFQMAIGNFHSSILRYQLAKINVNELELRMIPTKYFSEETAHLLREEFAKQFKIVLKVKMVNDIPYPEGGKTSFIIDETAAI